MSKSTEELRLKVRREVVKAQHGTIGELTDALMKVIESEVQAASDSASTEAYNYYQEKFDQELAKRVAKREIEVLSGVFINSPLKPAVGHIYIEVGDEGPILLSDYLRALAEIEQATLNNQTKESTQQEGKE